MAQRSQLGRMQIARAVSFIVLNSLVLGALVGVAILGTKYVLEPSLRPYVGAPVIFAIIFVYGRWVWAPLWKLGVTRRWT
jgi:hypothetical protein